MKSIILIILFSCSLLYNLKSQSVEDLIVTEKFDSIYKSYLILDSLRNFEQALTMIQKADSLASNKSALIFQEQQCKFRIGVTYFNLNQNEQAILYWLNGKNKTYELFSQTKDERYLKLFNKNVMFLGDLSLGPKALNEMKNIYLIIKNEELQVDRCGEYFQFLYLYMYNLGKSGDVETQLQVLDELILECDNCYTTPVEMVPFLYYTKAVRLSQLDQIYEAELSYRRAKELFEGLSKIELKSIYNKTLKELALLYSDYEIFSKLKNSSITILKEPNNPIIPDDVKKRGILILGEMYSYLNMADSSIFYFKLYEDAISESVSSQISANYSVLYLNLSNNYLKKKDFKSALLFASKFDSICKRYELPIDISTIKCNNTRGMAYLGLGDFVQSINAFSMNLQIIDSLFGKSKYYYENEFCIAKAHYFEKEYLLSSMTLNSYIGYNKKKIIDASLFMSEVELQAYIEQFESVYDYLFSIVEIENSPSLIVVAYDAWLFKQGYVLNSVRKIRAMKNIVPEVKYKYEELVNAQSNLSKELSKPQKLQVKIDTLMSVKNNREKELAFLSKGFAWDLKQINHIDILDALNKNDILLEFVAYQFKEAPLIDYKQYGVFILDPARNNIQFLSLFKGEELDNFLKSTSNFHSVNSLYGTTELSFLIWDKLLPFLKNKKRIYITSNGCLNKVNISALQIYKGQTIGDMFDIVNINSSKDLIDNQYDQTKKLTYNDAILYGNIDYSISSSYSHGFSTNNLFRGLNYFDFYMTDPSVRIKKWQNLKYSKKEVDSISKKLVNSGCKVNVFENANANELFLKDNFNTLIDQHSPELLHFSTHAYFFSTTKSENRSIEFSGTGYQRMGDFSLIQSGIVLSGANKHFAVTDSTFFDDGILTAFEISQLNLQNTKLVVLSACDTGLGEISNSEGVYGLRRAFKIAGVDKIVMSLWSVADYQTMELMDLFYDNICTKKMTERKALHEAQKTMRLKKYEPYYWAGFVIVE